MTTLVIIGLAALFLLLVMTLFEKFVTEPRRKLNMEIKRLNSNINSKEFTIGCLETQLLCKDMQIDLYKLDKNIDKLRELD